MTLVDDTHHAMDGPPPGGRSEPRRRWDGPAGLAVVVGVALLAALVLETLSRPGGSGEETAPVPLPPLLADGWLNTGGVPGPSVESLRGQLVVVDFWATWCGPCLQSMPKLVELHDKYRGAGVQVLGLTSEGPSAVGRVQAVIDRTPGFAWPVAYGTGVVAEQLGVSMLPTYVLFDRQGRSVWRGHYVKDLDQAIAARL